MEPNETQQGTGLNPVRHVTRLLGIEPGEFPAVIWSFLYFFCILGSYYMLRPVREAMAVESGPETIPWLFGGTFLVMLIATPIYGWIASKYPRKRFLPWVYYFFISNILIFWATFSYAISNELDYVWLSRIFFVWISVFNLYVVSVFWSFMADLYSQVQGRRLFGIISSGGSIGALLGAKATSELVVNIGFQNLMPISATLLLVGTYCITRLRREIRQEDSIQGSMTIDSGKPLGGSPFSGITHVLNSKYFLAIALASVIASLLGTALYMFSADLVQDAITNNDERTRFFSDINFWTNVFALIGQMLLVKETVRRFGLGVTLSSILTVARRALGFGLSKPTNDMLYSVVTPEEKYKAKNFIDTVLYRTGDVIGTWAVRFMVSIAGLAGTSLLMMPFAAIWAGIALWLGREYKRRDKELPSNA